MDANRYRILLQETVETGIEHLRKINTDSPDSTSMSHPKVHLVATELAAPRLGLHVSQLDNPM